MTLAAKETLCALCATGCGMRLTVAGGRIARAAGDVRHPVSRGRLCMKGARAAAIAHAPDRLTRPLLKSSAGFREISWDRALEVVAEKFRAALDRRGPGALAVFRGHIPGPGVLDAFAQLFAALGAPNATGAAHLCHLPSHLGFHLACGLNPAPSGGALPDYAATRGMVLWGANPSRATRVSAASEAIPRNLKRGVPLIVVDPVRTPLADRAAFHLPVAPGTDLALALAWLNVVVAEGLADGEFVGRWTEGFADFAAHLERFTPAWAEARCGVAAGRIAAAARCYAASRPALIDFGNGLDMHPNAVATARAIGLLMALTGNLDVAGGNRFPPHLPLAPTPHPGPAAKPIGFERRPLFPGAVFPEVLDALLAGGAAAPLAMLVYHGNPLLSAADETRVAAALARLDFLVVCDLFLTATAARADLVLPGCTGFERLGFKPLAVPQGAWIGFNRPVIAPIGQARPWYDIERELAERLGVADRYPWRTGREYVQHRIGPSGVAFDRLEAETYVRVSGPAAERRYLAAGFATPSGKVELCPERLGACGLDPRPAFDPPPGPTPEFPLIGTTRRPGAYIHTRYRNVPALRRLEPEGCAALSPEDAAARGIAGGDRVAVRSPAGRIALAARVSDRIPPGLVVVDFGWGNPGDGSANVNRLTADALRDPVAGSTPNRRFRCQVEKDPGP
jgi:anaerobic selenocysteine-containing dehydrogenase